MDMSILVLSQFFVLSILSLILLQDRETYYCRIQTEQAAPVHDVDASSVSSQIVNYIWGGCNPNIFFVFVNFTFYNS